MDSVGFIGLGKMGLPICKNLINSGLKLNVYNRTQAKAQELKEMGAKLLNSPASVAENSDLIFLMLSDSKAVESIFFGNNGLFEKIKKDQVIVDLSTIYPFDSIAIANRVIEKGAYYFDAPVIGSVSAAESRTLSIVVGGNKDVFESIKNILALIGKNVYYLGENGRGLYMKMINNLIMGTNMAILSEGLTLGQKLGIDAKIALEILSTGGANSRILELKKTKILSEDFKPQFTLSHQLKDMFYAVQLSKEVGASLPITGAVTQLYLSGLSNDLGNEDLSAIIKIFRKLNNI
jgi:3-hydroxyisobutyrate dehydrogenase